MISIKEKGKAHNFHYRPSTNSHDYWLVDGFGDSFYVGTVTNHAMNQLVFVIKNNKISLLLKNK